MPQINATFKPSIIGMHKAYAEANGISFSEAVEVMASKSVEKWFASLSLKQKKEFAEKYGIFISKYK